ncbi:MAG: T9SS type A sorting domain-containing protein, partial [Chitinophagales bacterium]|nr:T9SS type A sorting domain-containing protein [Chitinophagales bacterium]
GDAGSSVSACSAPEGYVGDNTDCNDADAAVNPGMTEVCNGVDDNCDGNIDEGVTITSYNDADLDGFGDAGMSNTGCTIPEGYILDNSDCNDASASIYPGAIEVCGNGIDDDCDGAIDVFSTITALGSTAICSGQSVTLQSTAAGSGYSYQWKRNGSIIAGATSSTYAATLGGSYTLYIYKPYCYSLSSSIVVSVLPVPSAVIVATDGLDLCVLPSLKLKANVGAGLTYQWYMDGNAIGGATSSIYFATAVGDYYVVVTNASGCSTQSATVTVFSGCRFGEEAAQAKMQVNPNPSNGNITIVGTFGTSVSNEATITVMNIAGERVAEFGTTIINGVINETISIPNVAGVYMITVVVDGNRLTTQAIITE